MKYKGHCQSCGMPLSKDEQGGGTEVDGSKSQLYCSYCYQKGQFTEPDITVDEMVKKVRTIMETQLHMPKFASWWMAHNIPRLDRWQKS